ncbi:MAG: AAA family ATPase [Cetobacterium sp.]
MKFEKAVKKKQKIRLLLSGPSGAGKTYTALRIATGIANVINGKIAVIDTERGSASLYSDIFNFDVLELDIPTIDNYIKAINLAKESGYEILIIDSTTHGWQQLLDFVEKLTNTKYKGNSFRAWGDGTPIYNQWVNTILDFGHIIVTARAKTEYTQEKDDKGKTVIKKIGMGTENRKGLEYEFTIAAEGDIDGNWIFSKSRVPELAQQIIHHPTEELGKNLYEWLTINGIDPIITNPDKLKEIKELMQITKSNAEKLSDFYNFKKLEELEDDKADIIINALFDKKNKMDLFNRDTWIKDIVALSAEKMEELENIMKEHKIENLEKASDGHLRAILKQLKMKVEVKL